MDKCDEWDFDPKNAGKGLPSPLEISNEALVAMYRAGFKAGYDNAAGKLQKLETLPRKYVDYLEDMRPAEAR